MASFKDDPDYLGPISATPQKMVEEMLAVAGVTAADVVFDLGCNDGRVLVTAAANAGARGVGVEIDEGAVKKARTKVRATSSSPASSAPRSSRAPFGFPIPKTPNQSIVPGSGHPRRRRRPVTSPPPRAPPPSPPQAAEAGGEHLVEIRHGNACAVDDLSSATVCFAYLLPKGNAKLSKKLMRSMAPGSRVVTYVFRLPEEHWDEHLETCKAVASTRDRGAGGGVDTSGFNKIFLYRVPESRPDWCGDVADRRQPLASQ